MVSHSAQTTRLPGLGLNALLKRLRCESGFFLLLILPPSVCADLEKKEHVCVDKNGSIRVHFVLRARRLTDLVERPLTVQGGHSLREVDRQSFLNPAYCC